MPKKTKPIVAEEGYVIGLFGEIYPKDFRYKISTEWELAEVKWLIKEGDFASIEDYEISTTKLLLSQP